jgi:hypothetical protein
VFWNTPVRDTTNQTPLPLSILPVVPDLSRFSFGTLPAALTVLGTLNANGLMPDNGIGLIEAIRRFAGSRPAPGSGRYLSPIAASTMPVLRTAGRGASERDSRRGETTVVPP